MSQIAGTHDSGPAADLEGAREVAESAAAVIDRAAAGMGNEEAVEERQVVAYDLASAASAVQMARWMVDYGHHGDVEGRLACAFVADAVHDLRSRMLGRESEWGAAMAGDLDGAAAFLQTFRAPGFLAGLARVEGPRHLDADLEMVAETFRRFADDKVRPIAEHVHRNNGDAPEDLITGLAELGAFGLTVPEQYGGFASGDGRDQLGMVVATEELSRGSLALGGSLITRPEIVTRALVQGGTEEQKRRWLPAMAAGEVMVAVAVTEPDHGSDVAGIRVNAQHRGAGWVLNGVKTWTTFAARAELLMVLVRTDPDRDRRHRGLSLFLVAKERASGHGFELHQDAGGSMVGRAIDTIGYRGMHSYEVAFEDWWVPAESLVGGEAGLGRGFYLQMEGFENGRLQTAARAVGLMQAAYEAARSYAGERVVFGRPIAEFQLTRVKLARMAVVIQACRQSMYRVAALMGASGGSGGGLEASMVKAYSCRAAEWVTREAMQIHGGMGYAEEFAVSRYFVDGRVLSIFEGAEETLALKVIARRLVARAVERSEAAEPRR